MEKIEKEVKVNSFKAWLLAARPKTLTGAAVPVMIGISAAIALFGKDVRIIPAILCMVFALIMQIDANFVNDYFDFMKGTDDETRLGPKRACAQGWITAPCMRRGIIYTTLLACAVGLPLVYYGGWEMVFVGFACVVFCFLYTISFSYLGLGDILVLVFFGIIPVCLTFWLVAPPSDLLSMPSSIIFLSIACGFVIDTLLIVNNYRDIDNDRRAGKHTLIVRIGACGGRWLYLSIGIIASLITCYAINGICHRVSCLAFLYLPFHVSTALEMRRINRGAKLNKVLGMTARNMFIYGILVSVSLLI